jgi:chitodextrinase
MTPRRSAFGASALVVALALVFTTAAAATPKTPTNLRITSAQEYTVSLAWNASSNRGGNWWYCVQRDGSGCIRVNPPQTTITLTRLLPDTTFNWSVYAIDSSGRRSGSSNTVTYRTPPDTTPPSPAPTLSATYVRPTRIGVSWTAATDNTSQVWYTLYVDGVVRIADTFGRFDTLFYLTPETTYEFKVTARDRFFNTVESNVISVTTPATTDTTPPTPPTNLTFPGLIENEVWADWDGSTDDVDPPGEILYDFYQNGELVPDGSLGATSGITYCRESGPTVIVVKAVDTSGNVSEPSNELLVDCP